MWVNPLELSCRLYMYDKKKGRDMNRFTLGYTKALLHWLQLPAGQVEHLAPALTEDLHALYPAGVYRLRHYADLLGLGASESAGAALHAHAMGYTDTSLLDYAYDIPKLRMVSEGTEQYVEWVI